MKKLIKSFGYAINGLVYAFRTQLNFKLHCLAILTVVVLGSYLQLSAQEWLWIVGAITLVIIVELINTAIETLVDMVSPQRQPKAGTIKDLAAAAVLIAAMFALIVALFIFVPKLIG